MTRADNPVVRLTYARYRSREIVVELHPTWMDLRLKGTRRKFALDYGAAWSVACKLAARAEMDEKRAKRKRKV